MTGATVEEEEEMQDTRKTAGHAKGGVTNLARITGKTRLAREDGGISLARETGRISLARIARKAMQASHRCRRNKEKRGPPPG